MKQKAVLYATLVSIIVASVPAIGCDTCNLTTMTFPLPPNAIAIERNRKQYLRCIDFDNIPPGHCCLTTVHNFVWKDKTTHQIVGTFTTSDCLMATPTSTACGSPAHPPFMANPNPLPQPAYWQSATPMSYRTPLNSRTAKGTSQKPSDCQCDVPATK